MGHGLRSALGWITIAAVVSAVSSYVFSLALGILLVTIGPIAVQLQTKAFPVLLWAYALPIITPRANSGLIIAGALAIYAVCFFKAARSNGGFVPSLRTMSNGSRPKALPNWLAIMPILASGLLIIVLLLGLLQDLFGVSTGSLPTGDPLGLLSSLAVAPIAEEIGFRITVLGLVTGILVAIRIGRNVAQGSTSSILSQVGTFFSAFLSPGHAKERVGLLSIRTGGLKGIGISEWIFLGITSAVFGLYHILGSGGWGPGKFLTAAISGFSLGVVFLAYGAFANILLHWFFDFYFLDLPGLAGIFQVSGIVFTLGALALGVWSIVTAVSWLSNWNPKPTVPISWSFDKPPPLSSQRSCALHANPNQRSQHSLARSP